MTKRPDAADRGEEISNGCCATWLSNNGSRAAQRTMVGGPRSQTGRRQGSPEVHLAGVEHGLAAARELHAQAAPGVDPGARSLAARPGD